MYSNLETINQTSDHDDTWGITAKHIYTKDTGHTSQKM